MPSKQTRDVEKHSDGGYTQTKIETYYIVQFIRLTHADLTGQNRKHACYYLRDKNRPNGKRRKWDVASSDWATFKFDSRAEAMKGVRSATVKNWLEIRPHDVLTEIVKIVETEVKSKSYDIVHRPGCNPLLALALEAE